MKIIPETHHKVEKLCGGVVEECEKLDKGQLADLLHECSDMLVTAKGSERLAVQIVQIVAVAMTEP